MFSKVWQYVEIGSTLIRAAIRMDGAIVTYTTRSVIDVDDPTTLVWRTMRAVQAAAARTAVPYNLNSMSLIGPNGGRTTLAQELDRCDTANNRDGQTYSTGAIVQKYHGVTEQADQIIAATVAFYAEWNSAE